MKTSRSRLLSSVLKTVLASTTLLISQPTLAQVTLSKGATVVAGHAAISNAGNLMNVKSSSNRTIINWDSFSVSRGSGADFHVPHANASVLNRVTSIENPSIIAGKLTSNGNLFLVNPSGIVPATTSSQSAGSIESNESTGGHVQIEGDQIALTANSTIDASGNLGGGTVLVGGDWQGGSDSEDVPAMTQATSVTMQAGSIVDASAIKSGNGGTIVLWSDVLNRISPRHSEHGSLAQVSCKVTEVRSKLQGNRFKPMASKWTRKRQTEKEACG